MPVPERIPLFFTKRDLAVLLGVVREPWLKEIIIIGVSTGMRRGELLNLRWTDVDLSRRLIQIQSHGTFKTKTGKRRVMPMSEVIFRLLSGKSDRTTSEYVFADRSKNLDGSLHIFSGAQELHYQILAHKPAPRPHHPPLPGPTHPWRVHPPIGKAKRRPPT